MRFAFQRAARVAAVHPLITRLRRDIEHAQHGEARQKARLRVLVEELEAAERANAALTRSRDLAVRALATTEAHLDVVEAELVSATAELDRLRAARYDSKLCPGCGQAADDDMNGQDAGVLADDLTTGYESVWPTNPTRQEPHR